MLIIKLGKLINNKRRNIMILGISLAINIILLYYIIHDTKYYNKVIKDLQEKYRKALEK